jgi:predicted dehydrogenase
MIDTAVAHPSYAPLRIGAIGTGLAMDRLHWPAIRRLPGHVQIVAFAEPDDHSATRFLAATGLDASARHHDYRELLARSDLDAVVVLLPIGMLYAAAKASLEAGLHVFCEKPPGGDLAAAAEFLALEAAHPTRTLFVAENFFYRDDLRLAREAIDNARLGRIHTVAWRITGQYVPRVNTFSSTPWRHRPSYRGGTHLDGGIHMMAAMRLLLGDPTHVHGLVQHANAKMGGPSTFLLHMTFASGAVGSYTAIHPEIEVPPDDTSLRIFGDEATMVLTPAYVQERRGFTIYPSNAAAEEVRASRTSGGVLDGGYLNEWIDFSNAVRTGSPYVGTVAQSVMNMVPILRGLDSAEAGGVAINLAPSCPVAPVPVAVPLWRPTATGDIVSGLNVDVTRRLLDT